MIPVAFRTPADGIAREEALLAAGRPALLLWRAETAALVVPASWTRREGFPAARERCAQAGWPLIARSSGGGGVPQGPGTLNLALVVPVPRGFTIEAGFRLICGAVGEALTRFEVATGVGPVAGSFCDGAWNVTAHGRKLAGTAQRWRARGAGRVALVHAALVLDPLPASFWTALGHAHRAAGVAGPIRPEAHVALSDVLPGGMRTGSVFGALARAAEDRLATLPPVRRQAA
ncbi:MAG: lipoate--protein ligase family protein [Bauldia sp.]|nr:lipoate--protein ligase family protein [Bauldia sp.]